MKILTNFHTSPWSKGETTELYISPETASLAKRDFDFRISIATINGKSKFTPFVGYNRILTLLEGELELIHKENHTSHLLPFDQDHFKGSWTTYSTGVAKDFNVISKEEVDASAEIIHLRTNQKKSISHKDGIQLIYLDEGSISINKKEIQEASLVLLENNENHIVASIDSVIIICTFQNIN